VATPSSATASPTASPAPSAAAAAARASADADASSEFYTVKKGDTLYSIALDNGQDYKDVAAWNDLTDANMIRVDQQLRVRPPPGWKDPAESEGGVVTRAVDSPPEIQAKPLEAPVVKKAPKALKVRYTDQALAQMMRGAPPKPAPEAAARPASPPPSAQAVPQAAPSTARAKPATPQPPAAAPSAPAVAAGSIAWAWPARGALLQPFDQGPNPKGIAIGGEVGQPVLASAAGRVVYSGSGLRGYGKLVIIKHDATYLSVYAHNRELRVKEGERVAAGQAIAEMGSFDAERPGLHFEIRRLGKPVDPLQYLPARGG
jgi:lipoprotein NlpD